MQHAFWGPEYPDERPAGGGGGERLPARGCAPTRRSWWSGAAGLIADGLVIGWYQGRSEWGPRALGNRSILANPHAADHEGHHQCQDQAARVLPALCAQRAQGVRADFTSSRRSTARS